MDAFAQGKALCQRLVDAGYIAYFAGGWVRDLLLDKNSDEIDIATSAPPQVVEKLFAKTIAVGAAFGVIVVVEKGRQFEISTFRKDHPYLDGRHPDGIDFSEPKTDAERRDFTINGMFYDPLTGTLLDYVEGQKDLKKGLIRAIGDPQQRFLEDRLRMVRAVRFAARLHFTIEAATYAAIRSLSSTLFPSVSMERIWQELTKMASARHFDLAICMLHETRLLATIFPGLKEISLDEIKKWIAPFRRFPKNCPAIAYLLELFPKCTLEEKIALCFYLKTSAKERAVVTFFAEGQDLLTSANPDNQRWAHFYAHPLSQLFIDISAAKALDPSLFIEEHQARQNKLRPHIERIIKKKPLVTSSHLIEKGIVAGPKMGILLKEAEKIAIHYDCTTTEETLSYMNL